MEPTKTHHPARAAGEDDRTRDPVRLTASADTNALLRSDLRLSADCIAIGIDLAAVGRELRQALGRGERRRLERRRQRAGSRLNAIDAP